MTEAPLRSITNSGTWMPILVPTYSTKIFIGWTTMSRIHSISYAIPFVQRYVTRPRFDRRYLIPSSISLPGSLFTRSVIQDPVTKLISHMLARFLWCCITERAQRYLTIIQSDKSQSRFTPTQQTPSEIPVEHLYDHPVMLSCFIAHKVSLRYLGVAWSHGRRNMYLTLRKH